MGMGSDEVHAPDLFGFADSSDSNILVINIPLAISRAQRGKDLG